jgi:putrescine transport system ATP-binding protein
MTASGAAAGVGRAGEAAFPQGRARDPAFLQIHDVVKDFGGGSLAVNHVSLEIAKGEIFALLGPSGCGKTTLLRMLAGFETPTSGRILLDGQDLANMPPYDCPINMMFQSYALFPHLSVWDNIAFGLRREGMARDKIAERVEAMLRLVQLGKFARRKPHQLSGGQQQRVALARSLAKRPQLLLLDEPLGALDKKLREATQFEIMNIQDKLGITFIVVTHDQEEAMTLSTRIGVMHQGQIVQIGTPQEIYEYPNTKHVADFVGSVNLFEGRLVEDEPDHVLIDSPDAGGRIYVDHGISSSPGARVWAAIRPEKITLIKGERGEPYNCLKGTVKGIAYMGNLSIYLVALDSGKEVKVTMPNQMRAAEQEIGWDDRVTLTWHANSPVVLLS